MRWLWLFSSLIRRSVRLFYNHLVVYILNLRHKCKKRGIKLPSFVNNFPSITPLFPSFYLYISNLYQNNWNFNQIFWKIFFFHILREKYCPFCADNIFGMNVLLRGKSLSIYDNFISFALTVSAESLENPFVNIYSYRHILWEV